MAGFFSLINISVNYIFVQHKSPTFKYQLKIKTTVLCCCPFIVDHYVLAKDRKVKTWSISQV